MERPDDEELAVCAYRGCRDAAKVAACKERAGTFWDVRFKSCELAPCDKARREEVAALLASVEVRPEWEERAKREHEAAEELVAACEARRRVLMKIPPNVRAAMGKLAREKVRASVTKRFQNALEETRKTESKEGETK